MKVIILAGGFGTRLLEETTTIPKPMVQIGGRPILWHIMKHYAHHGFREFVIALGFKGEAIKQYFLQYHDLSGDLTVHLASGTVDIHDGMSEDWKVTLIDTGVETLTGGRVGRLEPWVGQGAFMLTYGDGVSDVDLVDLLRFHRAHGRIATVTAVRPAARFGDLKLEGDSVVMFSEKRQAGGGWVNGGYMVFEPRVFEYIDGDHTVLERDVLEKLAVERQLAAYRHEKFWQCLDTPRDLRLLEDFWFSGRPPWRVWQ